MRVDLSGVYTIMYVVAKMFAEAFTLSHMNVDANLSHASPCVDTWCDGHSSGGLSFLKVSTDVIISSFDYSILQSDVSARVIQLLWSMIYLDF